MQYGADKYAEVVRFYSMPKITHEDLLGMEVYFLQTTDEGDMFTRRGIVYDRVWHTNPNGYTYQVITNGGLTYALKRDLIRGVSKL